mmetsp:Transcript_5241/g.6104  ORF Transcript_5241/g.6104 Transcript_5241/m.6104 type:complete len:90 (-) Transcript_5241:121-390(-)
MFSVCHDAYATKTTTSSAFKKRAKAVRASLANLKTVKFCQCGLVPPLLYVKTIKPFYCKESTLSLVKVCFNFAAQDYGISVLYKMLNNS